MAPGRYLPRNLLGGADGATLTVGSDGRIQGYLPAGAVGPRETLVLGLDRR